MVELAHEQETETQEIKAVQQTPKARFKGCMDTKGSNGLCKVDDTARRVRVSPCYDCIIHVVNRDGGKNNIVCEMCEERIVYLIFLNRGDSAVSDITTKGAPNEINVSVSV